MVGRGRPPRNARRFADRGSDGNQRDPRDIEIKHLQQRITDLEVQHEIIDEETASNPSDRDEEDKPFGVRRHNLHGMNRDDPLRNFRMKIEIPEFVGKAHPNDFIDCVAMVGACEIAARDGKSKEETWDKMKKPLRAKFLPVNHRQGAFLEYHNFCQRTSSCVEDFIAEFDRLRMRCAVDEEEEQTIARFLGALRADIADVVHLQQYLTYGDVCRLALKVEKQQKKTGLNQRPVVSRTHRGYHL
ncbi:reverse transcriptase domain-containing protein [Tanacetum coccineum]